jgi:hypothetical protein
VLEEHLVDRKWLDIQQHRPTSQCKYAEQNISSLRSLIGMIVHRIKARHAQQLKTMVARFRLVFLSSFWVLPVFSFFLVLHIHSLVVYYIIKTQVKVSHGASTLDLKG